MADRVHPAAGSPPPADETTKSQPENHPPKPAPPPGTYVIQVPKDQIYRVPPPENARLYKKHQKPRRSCCCCCLAWILGVLISLVLAAAIAAGIFYLVVRPKIPKYSVDGLSIKGINLTSVQTNPTLYPEFNVTVRAENPNKKIGIYYEKGSSVTVFYSDIDLCNGALPVFYQGRKNVTVFQTALTGNGIRLSDVVRGNLLTQQREGQIPLELDLRVPVRIKVGAVKTWKITVKVRCDLKVNDLTEDSRLVSKSCKVDVDL